MNFAFVGTLRTVSKFDFGVRAGLAASNLASRSFEAESEQPTFE